MDSLEIRKQEIEKNIVETVIIALEKNALSNEELPIISQFVLERIDNIFHDSELMPFLQELSSRWSMFQPLFLEEQHRKQQQAENEVASGVLMLAKHGKIEDALNLAKSVTQN